MAGDLLLLDGEQVAALLDPDDVFAAVRDALARHASGTATLFPLLREGLRSGAVFGIKGGTIDSAGLLGFKAAGRIEAIAVREGDAVRAGDELARLDSVESAARRAQAQAHVAAAVAALAELEHGFRSEEVSQARAAHAVADEQPP